MIVLQYDNILALAPTLPLFQLSFNIFHDSDRNLALALLQHWRFFSLVNGLNSLLHISLKIKLVSLQRILNIGDLIQAECYEVSIICLLDLLPVDVYLVAHQQSEIFDEVSKVLGAEEDFGMSKDDEVIGPRAFECLETVIEGLTFRGIQQAWEESLCNAYELLMRVVGWAFVPSFPFVNLPDLVIRGIRLETQLDVSAYIKTSLRFFRGNASPDGAKALE